jgi:hypothetical protein
MCCCGKPTINGELGYKWQPDDAPITRQVDPPDVADDETILYDEPGRCGGLDSHSHHFRVTLERGRVYLLVRHGGGDERMEFGWKSTTLAPLAALDSNGRYWLLCAAFHGMKDAASNARTEINDTWRTAAAEKRIRTRKHPGRDQVKVWIDQAAVATV